MALRVRKSTGFAVACLVLAAVMIFGGLSVSDSNANERARYDEAKSAGNSTEGVVVEAREDTKRTGGKRQRTTTVYCPVYEFTVREDVKRTFVDKLNCENDEEAVVIGSTAPVIFAGSGYPVFTDIQGTQDKLKAKQNGNTFLVVFGSILLAISLAVFVTKIVLRVNAGRSKDHKDHHPAA